ncbi:MAG: class II D-tagatose-bisphosphate aldolase, non-catalytic subunit, partial [Candidatus Omnitrophica bacterium]|nr:class II D-tagatose-bisphosphate aldolase, non-catalytic subunit [Candidatus Omnitrophota bacterium]
MKYSAVLVFLSFVLSSSSSLINSSRDSYAFRRAKTIESVSVLGLLGLGIENAPVFSEGLAIFRQIEERAKASPDNLFLEVVQASVHVLYGYDLLSKADKEDALDIVNMAAYYVKGVRRDQVKQGDDFRMLRFDDIKGVAASLQNAFKELIADTTDPEAEIRFREEMAKVTAVCQMAALWATSPVSSTPMLEALAGGKSTVMAINARYPQSIPGAMLAAKELNAPLIIEGAASEVNLEGGYTGQTPQTLYDTTTYWAAVLGFDLPYAIHADHTTVSKDSSDAIEKARILNQAQVDAGFTSFAIDPASLPAVREATQLSALNGMTQEDFMAIDGIGSILAKNLAEQGEFKSLKDVYKLFGEERKEGFTNLLNEVESRLLVKVLNGMTGRDLSLIPRISSAEVALISSEITIQGGFKTIEELKTLIGDRKVSIEGIGEL